MAIRWGIVSAGKMANDFVQVVKALPEKEHQLIAVAEWQLDQAQQFATNNNIGRAYGNFEDLARDDQVQIVYIAIVNSFHYKLAKLMLENDKHVLIEKPMTLCFKQTEELINLARAKGLFLMEGMWPRFVPSYRFVRKQIAEGVIGEIYHINGNIGHNAEGQARLSRKELGGGTVVDMALYCIDAIAQVFKLEEPELIRCIGHLNDDGVDIHCSAAFQFKNDKSATITSHSRLLLPREVVICGTKGHIRIIQLATCDDGIFRVYLNNQLHEFKSIIANKKLNLNFGSYGVADEVEAVRQCLLEERIECPEFTHQDSLYLARIEEEMRRQLGVVYECDLL